MTTKTTKQVPNPTGKGGFKDHPELRSNGGWKKENVFSYQYRRFMNMSIEELKEYKAKKDKDRTVVEDLAFRRVVEAQNSLLDVKEITDRTEGKAPQAIDITSKGESVIPIMPLPAIGLLNQTSNENNASTDKVSENTGLDQIE